MMQSQQIQRIKLMKRNVNGILLLDKPNGASSNEILQVVKRLYCANKAGHTGSLDPLATGMLPICFGDATKFSQFLLEANKSYIVTGKLGETTQSQDSESPVLVKKEISHVDVKAIEAVLPKFLGKTMQLPPMHSAIKHQGQPLYKLARQGITIERTPREITVYDIKLLGLKNDLFELEIKCSKGTYVRTIVADIGDMLGCGAHVVALRRSAVEPYDSDRMVGIDQIKELATKNDYAALDQLLLPIDSMLVDMPKVALTPDMVFYMKQGQAVLVPGVPNSGLVKMFSKSGKFLGVGEITPDGKITPRKMCQI